MTQKLHRRLTISGSSNSVGRPIAMVIWLLLTPFILHSLGPVEFGLWVVCSSLFSYGGLLDLGITGAVTKYVAEYRAVSDTARAGSFIATALRVYLLLGAIALLLSVPVAVLAPQLLQVPPESGTTAFVTIVLMGGLLAASIPLSVATAVLQGLQRYDIVGAIAIGRTLASAVLTVAVLGTGGGLVAMVATNFPIILIFQGLGFWAIRHAAPDLRVGWRGASREHLPRIVSFSWPLFLTQLSGRLESRTDEIVIAATIAITAVAPYAIARRLAEAATFVASPFVKVLLPMASEIKAQDDQALLRQLYVDSTRVTLAISAPLICALVLLAGPVISAWVGETYASAAPVVIILALAFVLDISQRPAAFILQGTADHRPLAVASAVAAVTNLALSLALAGPLGAIGVAIGTFFPMALLSLGFTQPYALRIIGVELSSLVRGAYLPALGPIIPMAATLLLLTSAAPPIGVAVLLLESAAGGLVYAGFYLALGAPASERATYRDLVLRAASAVTR